MILVLLILRSTDARLRAAPCTEGSIGQFCIVYEYVNFITFTEDSPYGCKVHQLSLLVCSSVTRRDLPRMGLAMNRTLTSLGTK